MCLMDHSTNNAFKNKKLKPDKFMKAVKVSTEMSDGRTKIALCAASGVLICLIFTAESLPASLRGHGSRKFCCSGPLPKLGF